MKLLFTSLLLCLAALVSGCQSWTTVTLTVQSVDAPSIQAAIESAITANGFSPCANWHAGVAGADFCLGRQVDRNSVTVAGFHAANAYVVKIGVYSAGRFDAGVRDGIEARCKEAMARAAPGARIVRTETGEPLQFQRI